MIQADEALLDEENALEVNADDELPEGEMPEGEEEDAEGSVVVQIGDEDAPSSEEEEAAPVWVKNVRKENRDLKRKLREFEAKGPAPVSNEKPVLKAKPTFESCDYDENKFQAELEDWHAQKLKIDQWDSDQKAKADAEKAELQKVEEGHSAKVAALKVKDYRDAEDETTSALNPMQVALIKNGCDDSAKVIYALGKNPAKLRELSQITNPVKFLATVAKLEDKIKMNRNATKTTPYSPPKGTARVESTDKTLQRLEAEAEKTGDRTKVVQYRKQLKAKSQKG